MNTRVAAIAAALLVGTSGFVGASTIDSFEAFQVVESDSGSFIIANEGVLGGEREVFFDGGGGGTDGENVMVANGFFVINSAFDPVSATITYDGVGDSGLGGVDFTSGGSTNGLTFDFFGLGTSLDLPVFTLDFAIEDTAGETSGLVAEFATEDLASVNFNSPSVFTFLFDEFVGSADLTEVDSLALTISGPLGLDTAIGSIDLAPVPLPGAAILFGTALLGGGVLRRRRMNATA